MEVALKYTTFQAIRPHFNILVKFIFVDMDDLRSGNKSMHFYNFIRVFGVILVVVYNIQYLLRVIEARHNIEGMVNILFLFLTTLMTLLKQFAFNVHLSRLKRLFSLSEGKLFSPKNSDQVKILEHNEKVMGWLQYLYHRAVMTTCFLYGVYPVVNRLLGQEVHLVIYFPFDVNSSLVFYPAVVYMTAVLTLQAYVHLLMDCTIASFYSQTRVQLKLLRYNLEHLVATEDSLLVNKRRQEYSVYNINHRITRFVDDGKLQEKLKQCINHYQLIIWYLREIESITCEALTCQFLVTAWVICLSVYKIVGINDSLASPEFWTIAAYLFCMLWQLLLYCYFGTQIKVESEFVCQAVYCGDWLVISPAIRRQLLIFMTRASRPIIPSAAKVVPISLQSYISVLRASYTLFTLLNKSNHNS